MNAPYPARTESERLAALDAYGILDTPTERAFDDIVALVGQLLDAPIVAVNLLAEGRQWFKSEIGLGTREMPLDDSICKFALLQQDRMIVPDTRLDARFACNPLVTGGPGCASMPANSWPRPRAWCSAPCACSIPRRGPRA